VVIPIEGLALAAVLAHRRRWLKVALFMGAGSTLGCIALGQLAYLNAPWVLSLLGSLPQSSGWAWIQAHLDSWGAGAVFAATFTPIPLQALVTAPALAGMQPKVLFAVIAVGRLGRALALCWAAAQAGRPVARMLKRFKNATKELRELDR
jgi:membrane protein YqaA with SNARE-associated domain